MPKFLIGLIVLGSFAAAATAAESHVRISAVANVSAVEPGKTVTVAVRFEIDDGWHIYWTNPGDSGVATRLKLAAPEGYHVGPVRYPTPLRIKLPGHVVSYGYTHEAVLLFDVTAPATAKGSADVQVAANWLVCLDTCIPGKAAVTVSIPIGTGTAVSAESFAKWAAAIPTETDPVSIESVRVDRLVDSKQTERVTIAVRWKIDPGDVAFAFATPGDDDKAKCVKDKTRTVITFAAPPRHTSLPVGLIFYHGPDGRDRAVSIAAESAEGQQTGTRRE